MDACSEHGVICCSPFSLSTVKLLEVAGQALAGQGSGVWPAARSAMKNDMQHQRAGWLGCLAAVALGMSRWQCLALRRSLVH